MFFFYIFAKELCKNYKYKFLGWGNTTINMCVCMFVYIHFDSFQKPDFIVELKNDL